MKIQGLGMELLFRLFFIICDPYTVVPLLRDHLQIQRNLVSEKRWSSKGGFIVCTVSAFVQGNSGL